MRLKENNGPLSKNENDANKMKLTKIKNNVNSMGRKVYSSPALSLHRTSFVKLLTTLET